MSTEIKAPTFPESVADGSIATWHKQVGESVSRDEPLVDIETDKVGLEVVAPADGVLREIIKQEGDTMSVMAALISEIRPSVTAMTTTSASLKAPAASVRVVLQEHPSVSPKGWADWAVRLTTCKMS